MKYRKLLILIIAFTLLTSNYSSSAEIKEQADGQVGNVDAALAASGTADSTSYDSYLKNHQNYGHPQNVISIAIENYNKIDVKSKIVDNFMNSGVKCLETSEDGFVDWQIDVPDEGLYNIELSYFPIQGHGSQIERMLQINNETPFEEASQLTFRRIFKDDIEQEVFSKDSRGNNIRPSQIEDPQWITVFLKDSIGFYPEPFQFYFKKGINTISLISLREPMVIKSLKLLKADDTETYEQYINKALEAGYKPITGKVEKFQAEYALNKSDPVLFPTYDRASPITEPNSSSKVLLNTIGGSGRWALPGQFISWEFDASEAGLYKIAFRCRQNMVSGVFVNRSLSIDGKIPFKEAGFLEFNYDSNWQMFTAGTDGEPFLFKLDKGRHILTLEVALGDLADILRVAQDSLLTLNDAYRRIIMVTGASVDIYRDYLIDEQLPDVMETILKQSEIITELENKLYRITGQRGVNSSLLQRLAYQLKDMYKDPFTIPARLDAFYGNLGSLGTWINSTRSQPLELDYFLICSPDYELPKANAGFLSNILHEFRLYISSYFEDYNSIGNIYNNKESIVVWITTGRDQAQILKQITDNSFVTQSGIGVNLQLIQPGVLLPAISSGKGPDVALNVANSDPVNYATRKAVIDISKLDGFEETKQNFYDSALVPYRYNGGTYALPEQQLFLMMFYRKDILDNLNLQVPKTWDDLYLTISNLQKKNLNFAMPVSDISTPGVGFLTFTMLLYQHAGQLYKDDGSASDLDAEGAVRSFKQWCELYQNYKLPVRVDYANRFRTGEIPLLITDFGFYNLISVFAPEIKNRWGFSPVPGISQDDGTINNTVPGFGTGCMIISNSKKIDEAWQFIQWWTGTDTQITYGREMESILGTAGRYPTANKEAAESLPWSTKDLKQLQDQWNLVKGIPEIPGGYFTSRHLDNAFRSVVFHSEDYRETLLDYVKTINDEIYSKRKEFGLETGKN